MALLLALFLLVACTRTGPPDIAIIGRGGTGDGEFLEPRGVSASDRGLAVLDKTGRLQLFDLAGRHLRTIEVVPGNVRRGLPIGVSWLPDGTLAVAHTHESRIVVYDTQGRLLRGFGKEGSAPGEFLMPQRVSPASGGRFLVCDHGIDIHRVQLVEADGTPVRVFGGRADSEGGLRRPMAALELPGAARFLVADQTAGLVLYGADGAFAGRFTTQELPADSIVQGMCRDDEGDVYVADLQRSEVRRYGAGGALRGAFGRRGVAPGELSEPWDVAWHAGWLYVADKENQRVVKVRVDSVRWE